MPPLRGWRIGWSTARMNIDLRNRALTLLRRCGFVIACYVRSTTNDKHQVSWQPLTSGLVYVAAGECVSASGAGCFRRSKVILAAARRFMPTICDPPCRKLLTAGDCAQHNQRLFSGDDGVGEGGVRRVVREVLLAGEEAQEGAALQRNVVANGPAQHRIAGFEFVEDQADCRLA